MSYETLRVRHEDGIDILTLHRPGALNAFNATMSEEIEDYFRGVNHRDEVRAVVVTGEGRAFCAGVDLSSGLGKFADPAKASTTLAELDAHYDDPSMRGVRDIGGRSALAIYDCTKPVIAAINGACVGIGATLTLPMDVRFASEDARIGFVFGRVGLVPEACSSWFLPRIVGMSRALEWCYRAHVMSAQEALAGGLLRELVPARPAAGARQRLCALAGPDQLAGVHRHDPPAPAAQQRSRAPGRSAQGGVAHAAARTHPGRE